MTQLPTRSTFLLTCKTKSSDRHTHLERRQTVWKWLEIGFSPEVKSQAHTKLSLPTLGGGIVSSLAVRTLQLLLYGTYCPPTNCIKGLILTRPMRLKSCLGVKFTNLRDRMLRHHKVAISGLSYWHEPLTEASSCAHKEWMTGSCMGCRCIGRRQSWD